jgi:predicted ArsR family transcriptional regulator
MADGPAKRLAGTRGRILSLLRTGSWTISGLAANVAISDNAVRAHITSLQRDGLVEDAGTSHDGGVGKPAQLYRVTERGEELFPKAYATVLGELLRVIGDRGEASVTALLREVGARAGRGEHAVIGDPSLRGRVEATARIIRDLGGDVEVVPEGEEGWRIQGRGCPLSAVVRDQAIVCTLIEALIAESSGGSVTQCCRHGDRPSCCFRVEPS